VSFTLYDADGAVIEERHSPTATTIVGFDDDFDATVASIRLTAMVATGGSVEVGTIGAGDWTLRAGSVVATYPLRVAGVGLGEEILAPPAHTTLTEIADGGIIEATVRLLSGESGNPLAGVGQFGLVARRAPRPADEVIADAVRAAAGADVAVVVVGLTEEQETEAVDKSTLALPGDQDALVEAVAGAARRTVVVVNAATPVLMPWLGRVDAVLWAGLPGQEAGHAIAAALVGAIEPAGRLVTTFPTADAATPAWSVTPVDGAVVYDEGTFIGYRGHHAGRAPRPAFWFGHGLGYGSWRYDSAVLAGERTVEVTVTNTASRPSREVVQVYFEPVEADQPVRLVGWQAVEVAPGASATVTVTGDARMWRRWDATAGAWAPLGSSAGAAERSPRSSGPGWKPAPVGAGGRLLVARGLGDVRATVPL
jgi:beta-glucosidase